ncbi:MAG: endonuclease/exonuclease/phosphatase family protein [Planctomycetota bacterium]
MALTVVCLAGCGTVCGDPELTGLRLEPRPDEYSILFYNANLIGSGKSTLDRARRIADIVLDSGHDIVALSEVFQGARPVLEKTLARQYDVVESPPPAGRRRVLDSGLMLAVRRGHEIVRSDSLSFEAADIPDKFAEKGAVFAKILLDGEQVIDVVVTHLQANAWLGAGTRRDQLEELRGFLGGKRPGAGRPPLVVAGDLNIPGPLSDEAEPKAEYSRMLRALDTPLDAFAARTEGGVPYTTTGRYLLKRRVDHILGSAGDGHLRFTGYQIRLLCDGTRSLSDHFSVAARFRLGD